MHIDLNAPNDLTIENVRCLIASGSDKSHMQLRVSADGIAYLSNIVGNNDTASLRFRLETWCAGNDYVGPKAALDDEWVGRIYRCLKDNWPTPSDSFIDSY